MTFREEVGQKGSASSLCLLTSERGPFLVPSAVEGAREGAAGDKFRVSGTKEMVEWAGANKESGGRFAH